MNFQVSIPDGSPELEELEYIIANINRENPSAPITSAQYLQNIIMGYFSNRVINTYTQHARGKSAAELKEVFGELRIVRGRGAGRGPQ